MLVITVPWIYRDATSPPATGRGHSVAHPDSAVLVEHGDMTSHVEAVIAMAEHLAAANLGDTDTPDTLVDAWSHSCSDHGWYAVGLLAGLLGKLQLSGDALRAMSDDIYGTNFIG